MPKAYSYIRMSSDLQLKGDSLRRQLAASEQYAVKHGLDLSEPIRDEGVSAYRGSNREFGNLRRFLDLIRNGKIERGSYLIVESLDRLSRQNVFHAFSLLGEIVQSGIRIVTLMDGQEYTEESFAENQGQVFIALGSMLRAHEESKVKSKRLIEAWKNKRANASTKVLTRRMPAWLKVDEADGEIKVIADRARVVKMIFQWARDGYGGFSIARRLNATKVSTWHSDDSGGKRAVVWYESYCKKVLGNRAVLGELQSRRSEHVNSSQVRRVADGDPVPNYYPRVIDDDLFLAAQAAIKKRRVGARGRKGLGFPNLFTGLLSCGYCGMPLRLWDRGLAATGGKFLICTSSWHKAGCNAQPWRYPQFEDAFLRFLRQINLKAVLGGRSRDDTLAEIRANMLRLDDQLVKVNAKIAKLTNALADLDDEQKPKAVIDRIREFDTQAHHLRAERSAAEMRLNELLASQIVVDETEMAALIDKVAVKKGKKPDEDTRRLVASEIRRVVELVTVFTASPDQPYDADSNEEEQALEKLTRHERNEMSAYFVVRYHSGESEYVQPNKGRTVVSPDVAKVIAKRKAKGR
jgi:DNA invertase Pin-like site-specific DNA recombinase